MRTTLRSRSAVRLSQSNSPRSEPTPLPARRRSRQPRQAAPSALPGAWLVSSATGRPDRGTGTRGLPHRHVLSGQRVEQVEGIVVIDALGPHVPTREPYRGLSRHPSSCRQATLTFTGQRQPGRPASRAVLHQRHYDLSYQAKLATVAANRPDAWRPGCPAAALSQAEAEILRLTTRTTQQPTSIRICRNECVAVTSRTAAGGSSALMADHGTRRWRLWVHRKERT